jgi:peptidoglycan/xylan/chitin deacetylase (PgdA/CDA1 family)
MHVCITIDMEHDCPPYLNSYTGVVQGLPKLLQLLHDYGVRGTFFTTGDVARRFPAAVRSIVEDGHELGCHGDTHARFSDLDADDARQEVEDASATLRAFAPVTSFRAPNLDLPADCLPLLRQAGYRLDSSQGRYKPGSFFAAPHIEDGLTRIPASIPPSVVRLPGGVRNAVLARLASPVVLFFHPWEFVDMTRSPIPYDCRFRTGDFALRALAEAIAFLKERGAAFRPMRDTPLS